jgi:hypothetical protein
MIIQVFCNACSASSLTIKESTQNSSSKSQETQTQGRKVISEKTCTNKQTNKQANKQQQQKQQQQQQPKHCGKLNLALFDFVRENLKIIHVEMPEITNKRRKKCRKIFLEVGISVILLWK